MGDVKQERTIVYDRDDDVFDVCDGLGFLAAFEHKDYAEEFAAAPDVLKALKEAKDLIRGDLVGSEWKRACNAFLKSASAAIAKAEGK